MPTLILPPRLTEDCEAMRDAALRAGWDAFHGTSWRIPEELAARDPVLYADPLFADVAAGPLNVALLDVPLNWLTTVPPSYLKRRVTFTTLADARRLSGPLFVKPADDKCFSAQVYPSGAHLPKEGLLPDELPVLAAEPVVWAVEFRCFVLNKVVRTVSPYLRYGELAQGAEGSWLADEEEMEAASGFAAEALADEEVRLPPAVVLDVGIIEGRGWAVIEANGAWGSGIYGCNPDRVLPVIRRSCVPRDTLSDEDAEWVRPVSAVEW